MKKDFKLLLQIAVEQLSLLAVCDKATAKRDFLMFYREALAKKVQRQHKERRNYKRNDPCREDRCVW